jgi:hypothetical protein
MRSRSLAITKQPLGWASRLARKGRDAYPCRNRVLPVARQRHPHLRCGQVCRLPVVCIRAQRFRHGRFLNSLQDLGSRPMAAGVLWISVGPVTQDRVVVDLARIRPPPQGRGAKPVGGGFPHPSRQERRSMVKHWLSGQTWPKRLLAAARSSSARSSHAASDTSLPPPGPAAKR